MALKTPPHGSSSFPASVPIRPRLSEPGSMSQGSGWGWGEGGRRWRGGRWLCVTPGTLCTCRGARGRIQEAYFTAPHPTPQAACPVRPSSSPQGQSLRCLVYSGHAPTPPVLLTESEGWGIWGALTCFLFIFLSLPLAAQTWSLLTSLLLCPLGHCWSLEPSTPPTPNP